MAPPTALITGASSGIGLSLTHHLLSLGFHVIMADLHPPPSTETLPNTLFIPTDISSWSSNAALFQKAYTHHSRLDFIALNAGIDDRDDILNSISRTTAPSKPRTETFEVNLLGTYFGLKLSAHYLSLLTPGSGKVKAGGKIVVTASAAGIYPLPNVPQYTATKHALIGLVRALAPAARDVNITINAVCPALVKTNLAPPGMLESFSEEDFTPMGTIMRCFDELADLEDVGKEDWVEQGRNGDVVEGNKGELVWHYAPTRPESSSYVDEEGQKVWARAYLERNKGFVAKL